MCEIRALVWFCKLLFFFFYCADLIFKANWASSLNTDMLLWHIIMTDLLLLPLKKKKVNLLENSSFTYPEQTNACEDIQHN